MAKNLTPKEREFVNGYLRWGNATEAAFTAYNCKNRNVAGVIGWENLRKPKVLGLINLSLEPDEVTLASVAQSLKHVLDNGTPKERLKALEICLKSIGAI